MKTKFEKTIVAILSGTLLIIVCGIIAITVIEATEAEQPEPEMQTYELDLPPVEDVIEWYYQEEEQDGLNKL
jgi:cell division protein FtsN